jgi:hypothetical protein
MTWWLTEKTVIRARDDLRTLGYPGSTLTGVDPDTEGFHDFTHQEIELMCIHETDLNGFLVERWKLRAGSRRLADKTKLRELDRVLARGINGRAPEGYVATDADVSF